MQTAIQSATFHGQQLSIIDHENRKWLTSEQVGLALGYSPADARTSINRLFKRHEDEFLSCDVAIAKMAVPCEDSLTSQPQARDYRIFSDTGCIKLGFFANTPRAKEFRTWASRELAGREPAVLPAPTFDPVVFDQAGRSLIAMVQALLPQHSLRKAYQIANAHIKATTGQDVLSVWPIVLDELDDVPPPLPSSLPVLPWSKAKTAKQSHLEKQLARMTTYLRHPERIKAYSTVYAVSRDLIASLLAQGYIPRQVLIKRMHATAAEFNMLVEQAKERDILKEVSGIEFNYAGTLYVAGGAA